MSETDDTDVLLLIPPNFFRIHSSGSENSLLESSRTVVHKPPSCTAHVIGKLVNQVYSLENRLESLELSTASDISSRGVCSRPKTRDYSESFDSSDRKYSTFPRRRRKRNFSRQRKQESSPTSLDSISTCSKHIPRLKFKTVDPSDSLDSLVDVVQSMDGDLSSIVSTPSKKNDKLLLNEIDEFLTRVENYNSPDSKYRGKETELSAENVIKATSNYFSNKLDDKNSADQVELPSGRVVPSNILDKYIYLVNNNATNIQTENSSSSKNHCSGDATKLDITPKASENNRMPTEAKSQSIRKLNFVEPTKDCQPTSTPKRPTQTRTYLENFRPSSNKIYDRASKVLELYKAHSQSHSRMSQSTNDSTSQRKEDFKVPQRPVQSDNCHGYTVESHKPYRSEIRTATLEGSQLGQRPYDYYKPIEMREGPKLSSFQNKYLDSIDTDLLSLSDLWGEKKDGVEKVDSVKLEEEKMKREHCETLIQELQKKLLEQQEPTYLYLNSQHCETLIQELQKKLLEQQERLAVALRVDRSKDTAINKLKEAWLRLTSSLDRAEERHRSALEKMTREVDNFKLVADDAQKKTNHFETELYKALDLAHDYQEKCKQLAQEKKGLQDTVEKTLLERDEAIGNKQKELEVIKENYDAVMRLNKQSAECVKNVDQALEKEKKEHELTRHRVAELTRKLQTANDETTIVKQERDMLKEKVNEERARCNILEGQLADKQNLCSELLRKCDTIDNEAKYQRKQLELQKNELKSHYQKQLEDAVLSKLQEFQVQLDRAEKEMANENRNKENAIVDTYNMQMNRIEEQHRLEINVLEEKHKEEIKLYRLQLAQSAEKISLLQSKVESYRRRRGSVVSALHSVMQTQWRHALQILTGAVPPAQIQVTACREEGAPALSPETAVGMTSHDRDTLAQLDTLSDTELQHYVKLLLNKPAHFDDVLDLPQHDLGNLKEQPEEPTSDRPDKERKDKGRRALNASKPPWKA